MTRLFPNLFREARNRVICSELAKGPLTCADAFSVVFARNRSGTVFDTRILFRTGQNNHGFALVNLFRTDQNRLRPGSSVTVPRSLSIGEGTGPSPQVQVSPMRLWTLSIETSREGDMSRARKKLEPGAVAVTCDKCGTLISDDDGYLCVVDGHGGVKRWRAFHDGCKDRPHLAGRCAIPIVVRSSRVSTYSQLLVTLADLATDPRIDFANTAWPALLQRLAFDTDWERDGRKAFADLEAENRSALKSAGLWNKAGVPISARAKLSASANGERRRTTKTEGRKSNS